MEKSDLNYDPRPDNALFTPTPIETYEGGAAKLMLDNTKQVFWDVGANHGVYSIYMARAGKEVLAFEPIPENIQRLDTDATKEGLDKLIQGYPIALSSVIGTVTISTKQAESSIDGTTRLVHGVNGFPSIEVKALTIDYCVSQLSMKPPDFIKIDVEGHELEVLRGGIYTLFQFKPKVLVECHRTGFNDKWGIINKPTVLAFLSAMGYDYDLLANDRVFAYPSKTKMVTLVSNSVEG